MIERAKIYDIVYALMACDGREAELFGNCAQLAHDAFVRSCAGNAFPELWFEIPLAGEPWFDLHALTARETLESGGSFSAEETGGYPELFEWFATAQGVRQLALSYDVHTGTIDSPAVQLLARDSAARHLPFLELVAGESVANDFRAFVKRLPDGWFPCYTGVFPGREGMGVRVECIPADDLQRAYASDAALLEEHLRRVGLEQLGDTVVPRCQLLARSPFRLEFQFDVREDGVPGATFGASVRFQGPFDDASGLFGPNGAVGKLMECVEGWGLADGRWRRLAETVFAKRITCGDASVRAIGHPAFVKLRWRAGEPLDAKAYLRAEVL